MAYTPVQTVPGERIAQRFSWPSILALGVALASLFVHPLWSLLLVVLALALGALGLVLALSPRVRGGFISALSIGAAGLAVVLALFRLILALLF